MALEGEIHHYDGSGGQTDDSGEPLLGFYYVIKEGQEYVSSLMGPYNTAPECETACQNAASRCDFT